MMRLAFLFMGFCLIFGCAPEAKDTVGTPIADEVVYPKYAKHFFVRVSGNKRTLVTVNPWTKDTSFLDVSTPRSTVLPFSSTHVGFLTSLGLQDHVVAIADRQYLFDSLLQSRIGTKVQELGMPGKVNVEQVIALDPSIIFVSGWEEMSGGLQLIEKAGVTVFPIFEWKESQPLARTEWILAFGEIFGQREQAKQLFESIENDYLSAKKNLPVNDRLFLSGNDFRGTWHMPGGASFLASIYKEANLSYFYKNDSLTGSLPLSFETVLDEFMEAEIWMNPGQAQSMEELYSMDDRYKDFKAAQDAQVYNFYKKVNAHGANDYWESGVMHPHHILSDYIEIFHGSGDSTKLHYYQRLK